MLQKQKINATKKKINHRSTKQPKNHNPTEKPWANNKNLSKK